MALGMARHPGGGAGRHPRRTAPPAGPALQPSSQRPPDSSTTAWSNGAGHPPSHVSGRSSGPSDRRAASGGGRATRLSRPSGPSWIGGRSGQSRPRVPASASGQVTRGDRASRSRGETLRPGRRGSRRRSPGRHGRAPARCDHGVGLPRRGRDQPHPLLRRHLDGRSGRLCAIAIPVDAPAAGG